MLIEAFAAFILNCPYFFLKISSGEAFPPPLSAAKEREYFIKCKNGDKEARYVLIERNLRLVAHIVKKYYTSYKDQDDLISIGTIGLIKAIDSFRLDTGARFATYASKCLQNEILMHFRAQKKNSCETSIYDSIDVDKDGNPLTYIELISSEDTIVDDIDFKIKSGLVYRAIDGELSGRERNIIVMRYGLDNNEAKTQKEIAELLGISRSYVSRIEKVALKKIHAYINKPKKCAGK